MKNIFILGSINTDLVITAPYMPHKGETLMGRDFFTAHGGKGANQAVAAARSNGQVYMCGCVGDDLFGKSALEALQKERINCDHIKVVENTPTGTAVIVICDGDNRIILDSGANSGITKEQIDSFLSKANKDDLFLTQLENPIDIVGYALNQAKAKGMIVVLNPAPAHQDIEPYLQYVDILIPNEGECELLGGEEKLLKEVSCLIVTLGEKGFKIRNEQINEVFPCIKIEPVDTTAAGDTFCGAMLARYSKNDDLIAAATYGSCAASLACTKKGAQPSIPHSEEIEKFASLFS